MMINPLKSYISLNGYDDWLLKYFLLAINYICAVFSHFPSSSPSIPTVTVAGAGVLFIANAPIARSYKRGDK